jgi:AcrR family transcriptional regulator
MVDGGGGRLPNRRGQGERLRGEILAAACGLVSQLGGAEALTVRGVARAVGIAPASIYTQFADKAALTRGLINYDYTRLCVALRAADQSVADADVVGRARAQVHAYCRFALDNPGHYRLMLGSSALVGDPGCPESSFESENGDGPGGSGDESVTTRTRPSGSSPLAAVADEFGRAFARCAQAGVRLRLPAQRVGAVMLVAAHGRVALYHTNPSETDPTGVFSFLDELMATVCELSRLRHPRRPAGEYAQPSLGPAARYVGLKK